MMSTPDPVGNVSPGPSTALYFASMSGEHVLTARSMPTTAARATMEKPMLSSAISGMATIGPTFR